MLALQFIASAIAMLIGFGGTSGPGIDEPDPQAALGSLIDPSRRFCCCSCSTSTTRSSRRW